MEKEKVCPCFENVNCNYAKKCDFLISENNTIYRKCPKKKRNKK